MILNEMMKNPYAWAVLSICTIAALIFAMYTWFAGKRKKEISYYKDSYEIVKAGNSLIPELKLFYQEKEIEDLIVTKFAIWNSGNEVLNWSDIVEVKPLRVFSNDDKTNILDVKIIGQSDETNMFVVDIQEETTAKIKFDYANVNDGIVLQVMHTGKVNTIEFDGKIKGGKKLKCMNKVDKKINYKKSKKIMIIMSGIMVILCILMTVIVLVIEWNIIPKEALQISISSRKREMISIGSSIILIISIIAVCFSYLQLLKKTYHIDIPTKIRNIIEQNSLR